MEHEDKVALIALAVFVLITLMSGAMPSPGLRTITGFLAFVCAGLILYVGHK